MAAPAIDTPTSLVVDKNFVFPHEDLDMPDLSKAKKAFRVYEDPREDCLLNEDQQENMVYKTYYDINTKQTVEYVRSEFQKWTQLNHGEFTLWEVLDILNEIVDESDPDTTAAQKAHSFQTAERCRKMYPDNDWMHLLGLIHDCGKLLAFYDQPQWSTVGDTFPIGCAISEKHMYSQLWWEHNVDAKNPLYQSRLGMYRQNQGFSNILMTWGHDEYLYQVLKRNPQCTLPEPALYVVRFHSFYTHHQHNDYEFLMDSFDHQMKDWLIKFQLCDLYSKTEDEPEELEMDINELRPYYQGLIEKYCPGKLK
eukprot:Awhi_evm1s14910